MKTVKQFAIAIIILIFIQCQQTPSSVVDYRWSEQRAWDWQKENGYVGDERSLIHGACCFWLFLRPNTIICDRINIPGQLAEFESIQVRSTDARRIDVDFSFGKCAEMGLPGYGGFYYEDLLCSGNDARGG